MRKSSKKKFIHFVDKVHERISSAFTYARITTSKLQTIIVHASTVLAASSRFFPPIAWLLDSIHLIIQNFHPKSKIDPRISAASTFLASITLGVGIFSLYALTFGIYMWFLPYAAIIISAIMAISYLALAYSHHLNSSSKDFIGLEQKIKGLLENDQELKSCKDILFFHYISQDASLKDITMPLDMDKANSDKNLQGINKTALQTFFETHIQDIQAFRRSSQDHSRSLNKLLLSAIYLCSLGLAIIAAVAAISTPAILGFLITAISIGLLIKKSRLVHDLKYTFYEWSLTISPNTQKIYDKMKKDLLFNTVVILIISALIILASFNIVTPIVAVIAIMTIALISGISQLINKRQEAAQKTEAATSTPGLDAVTPNPSEVKTPAAPSKDPKQKPHEQRTKTPPQTKTEQNTNQP